MAPAPRRAQRAAHLSQDTSAKTEPPAPNGAREPWPQGISRHATMRISDVLAALETEFPAVSHSKLRFLEEQGLVTPVRTPAGYRQYSPADVERLRYVLRQQRDRYLPLKVIGAQLAELDAGRAVEGLAPHLATQDGETARQAGNEPHTPAGLADLLGVEESFVADLLEAGVVTADAAGRLAPWTVEVVRAAAALAEHGLEARHLRAARQAADRQVDLVEQLVAPWRSQRSASARARAATIAAEAAELMAQLHTALVRGAASELDR